MPSAKSIGDGMIGPVIMLSKDYISVDGGAANGKYISLFRTLEVTDFRKLI